MNSPWLRALPDFGNSLAAHDEDYAYRAMDAMFAHAYGICHVKDGEADDRASLSHVELGANVRDSEEAWVQGILLDRIRCAGRSL